MQRVPPKPCGVSHPMRAIHRAAAPFTVRRRSLRPIAAANRSNETATGSEANSILDAFFLGRAFAETVNERLGAALGDILSEVSKRNAERDYWIRSFQQEVQQRADREKEQRTGLPLGTSPSSASAANRPSGPPGRPQVGRRPSGSGNGIPGEDSLAVPDLQEVVDELRAEIATAKASVQQLKISQMSSTPTSI